MSIACPAYDAGAHSSEYDIPGTGVDDNHGCTGHSEVAV